MKVGLIARSEDRGLGNMTWEWAEHMHPDRVLVVVPNHPIRQRLDRYPDATVVRWDPGGGELDEPVVRGWLDGLDVVYSAETFYDWRVCWWARDAGVRTVCHVMPEFYRHGGRRGPVAVPDAWWAPTRWRLRTLPEGTRVVPVPIATERFAAAPVREEGPMRWLHPAGTPAAADRNGTHIVLGALPYLTGEHHVRVQTQAPLRRAVCPPNARLMIDRKPVPEYWQAYADADALVLPRRYGGLSLPALEAMGAGLAVVMSDAEPQRSEWPILPVACDEFGAVRTPAGSVPLACVAVRDLAAAMDDLAAKPDLLAALQLASRCFADEQSWANLAPLHRAELERACG